MRSCCAVFIARRPPHSRTETLQIAPDSLPQTLSSPGLNSPLPVASTLTKPLPPVNRPNG